MSEDWKLHFAILEDAYRSRFMALFAVLNKDQQDAYNEKFKELKKEAERYMNLKEEKDKRTFEKIFSDDGIQPFF